MATPKPALPFPNYETLDDYYNDGTWDCRHAFDVAQFEPAIQQALLARKGKGGHVGGRGAVEYVWTPEYRETISSDWINQADLDGHPRAREAFDAWANGWMACAATKLNEIIRTEWYKTLDDAGIFYVLNQDAEELERFDDIDDALLTLAKMPVGSLLDMEIEDTPSSRALLAWIGDDQYELATAYPIKSSPGFRSKRERKIGYAVADFRKLREAAERRGFKNPATKFLDNPPWVAKVLAKTFESMEHGIPPKWLPQQGALGSRGTTITSRVDELGCGAYGCALPTLDPNVVLKVTTDETEAQFAEKLSKTLVVPVVTRYEAVMLTDMEHDGRPVALLWREEAKDIGKLKGKSENLVSNQHAAAQDAFDLIANKQVGPELRAALANWEKKTEAMKASAELEWLARGLLRVYREQGIFFGDLHAGNLGKCKRDGQMRWVVTDPGHVAVVKPS